MTCGTQGKAEFVLDFAALSSPTGAAERYFCVGDNISPVNKIMIAGLNELKGRINGLLILTRRI